MSGDMLNYNKLLYKNVRLWNILQHVRLRRKDVIASERQMFAECLFFFPPNRFFETVQKNRFAERSETACSC